MADGISNLVSNGKGCDKVLKTRGLGGTHVKPAVTSASNWAVQSPPLAVTASTSNVVMTGNSTKEINSNQGIPVENVNVMSIRGVIVILTVLPPDVISKFVFVNSGDPMVFCPLIAVFSVSAVPERVLLNVLVASAFESTVSVPVASILAVASSVSVVLGVSVRVKPLDVNEVALPVYTVS